MNDESWDEQFKRFLRKTGEDFRRTGEDIKAEAQKLVDAAMDPEKQQRVRDRLNELGVWAQRTAHGVAGAMQDAASKAEDAFYRATDKVSGGTSEAPPPAPRKPAAAAKKAGKAKAAKPAKKAGKAKAAKPAKKAGKAKAAKPPKKAGAKRKR
jgi:hypothetical protein